MAAGTRVATLPSEFVRLERDMLDGLLRGKHYESRELHSVATALKDTDYRSKTVACKHPEEDEFEFISTRSQLVDGRYRLKLWGGRNYFPAASSTDRSCDLSTALVHGYTFYLARDVSEPEPVVVHPKTATSVPAWGIQSS